MHMPIEEFPSDVENFSAAAVNSKTSNVQSENYTQSWTESMVIK